MYDVIIIGGGPAGMTAGIYCARYKLNTLIIAAHMGGMAADAHKICNFPSYIEIQGIELMEKVRKQVEALKVPIELDTVMKVEKAKDGFVVETVAGKEYRARKVILAIGTVRRKLDVNGEEEFLGKGVSYCASCDGALFQDKVVGVVGGSDAALTAALLLAEYASKVHLIYRQKKFFRAEPSWIDLVMKNKKIATHFSEEVDEVMGGKFVEKLKLKSGKVLEADGLFIEIGSEPNLDIVGGLGVKHENNYVVVDHNSESSIPGLYACGDIRKSPFRQIVIAAADGALAAYDCYKELKRESA